MRFRLTYVRRRDGGDRRTTQQSTPAPDAQPERASAAPRPGSRRRGSGPRRRPHRRQGGQGRGVHGLPGVRELDGPDLPIGRVRRAGCGRRPLTERDPGLLPALLSLARSTGPDGTVRSPLEWTTLSVRELAQALTLLGHPVGPDTVSSLLKAEGFTLQPSAYTSVRGTREHRIARLRHGAALLRGFTDAGHPVLRVRTEPVPEPGPRPGAAAGSPSTTPGPPYSSPTPSATGGRRRADAAPAHRAAAGGRRGGLAGHQPRHPAPGPGGVRGRLRYRGHRLPSAAATLRWRTAQHRLSCQVTACWDGLPAAGEHVLIGTVGPLQGQVPRPSPTSRSPWRPGVELQPAPRIGRPLSGPAAPDRRDRGVFA
ncbi:hypothetical protein ACFQVA_21785 [Actinomadura keratinilytica]